MAKITREQAEKMTPKEAAYCEAEAVSYEADTIIRSKTILYLAGRGVIGMSSNTGGKGKPGGDQERYLWNSPDTATGQELFLSGGGELSARWVKKKKERSKEDEVGSTSKEATQES